jgi:hypothetical protein
MIKMASSIKRVKRLLNNEKKIEKRNVIEIDTVLELLNDMEQDQINYKYHLKRLKKLNEERYKKEQEISDYAKVLAFDSAIMFFESDIEGVE